MPGEISLDVPAEILDDIAGLSANHAAKIFAEQKYLGPVAFNILGALGLRIVVVEDPAALARAKAPFSLASSLEELATQHQSYPAAICR